MGKNNLIPDRDLESHNVNRITALSESIQKHFQQFREESMAATEFFQVHVNQEELNSLDFPPLSRNSNNNTPEEETQVIKNESFHSLPSDNEDNIESISTRSSLNDLTGNEPPLKSIGKKLRKMTRTINDEDPKPQREPKIRERHIKKANKKYTDQDRSRSVFDYFKTYSQAQLDQDVLNDAILHTPTHSETDKFTFTAPQSVISLPEFSGNLTNTSIRSISKKNVTTSIGSSLGDNDISPNLIDQLTAGGSKDGNAPSIQTMQDFLSSENRKRQFVNSAHTESSTRPAQRPNTIIESNVVRESIREPINTSQTNCTNTVDIDFDVSNYINECNRQVNITLQTRMDVRIFPPALSIWRQLRMQQGRKVTLELRIAYHEKLISTNHYPEWTVSFHPPASLLNSQKAIDEVVDFRSHNAKEVMSFTIELMREESARLTHEINVGLNSLRMHYEHDSAQDYDMREALEALNTFMRRTKENEVQELNKKYTAISSAPLTALYSGFPEGTVLPTGAVKVFRQERVQTYNQPQGFQNTGRGTRCPTQFRGRRGNFQPNN